MAIGGAVGSALAAGCFFGPFSSDGIVIGALVWLATPMVRALELVAGKPMQQEMEIVAYLFAIPSTLIVIGAVLGLGLDWTVRRRRAAST